MQRRHEREFSIIGDGDDGYGNAMNVKRTVKGYAKAGFAGVLIEDQVAPKACGHTKNRRAVSREEATTPLQRSCMATRATRAVPE